ncbi:MAG: ABC transporter ATP-binding protein [Magnetococcales bacterium]|nr:ABC transporter ATP-binding protein [Magnetococcales bacterium]
MSVPALAVEGVIKQYPGRRALNGVSFAIPPGVCVALLGHNGAGKTTLMKLLLGLTRPTAGAVRVLGENPAEVPLEFRRQIGFLPENVIFHDELTGRDTLRFYARLKGERLSRCDELLARVGLAEAAGRRVKTYSKGMRQRLGLAQALLGEPKVLLLDEPTTGLDPMLRQEFYRIIQELRDGGSTILLSSHVLTELEARTDLAAILRQGELAAWGSLDELRCQADLPVRLRLASADEAADVAQRLDGLAANLLTPRSLEVVCAVSDKMAALRQIAELGEVVVDLEIQLPSLDDVYVHFGHHAASEEDPR